MRSQRRPVRVVYAVAPDVLACAALSDALAVAVHDGAGLAVLPVNLPGMPILNGETGGEVPAAALAQVVNPSRK